MSTPNLNVCDCYFLEVSDIYNKSIGLLYLVILTNMNIYKMLVFFFNIIPFNLEYSRKEGLY